MKHERSRLNDLKLNCPFSEVTFFVADEESECSEGHGFGGNATYRNAVCAVDRGKTRRQLSGQGCIWSEQTIAGDRRLFSLRLCCVWKIADAVQLVNI